MPAAVSPPVGTKTGPLNDKWHFLATPWGGEGPRWGRHSDLSSQGRGQVLAPGSSILRDKALAWPDSCGLISRAIPRLLILTHLVFFIPEARGGMGRDWEWGRYGQMEGMSSTLLEDSGILGRKCA